MSGNIIVSTLTNRVVWDVDQTSYGKALKAVKSIKAAHEKPAKALEKAQKRTAQMEGKASLASAKAQTAKLRQLNNCQTATETSSDTSQNGAGRNRPRQ